MSQNSESDARVAQAIQTCMGALSTLSNRETALVLRALAGMNNLVVQAPAQIATRSQAQSSKAQSAKDSNRGKASSTPNPANKDPRVLAVKSRLKENALAVRNEAARLKVEKLPEDHPLVVEREALNVEVRSFRDSITVPTPEVTSGKGKGKVDVPPQSGGTSSKSA